MKTDRTDDKTFIEVDVKEVPAGVDRRRFLMRSATISAAAVLTGCTTEQKTEQVGGAAPPSGDCEQPASDDSTLG